jgi:hypothetical protein
MESHREVISRAADLMVITTADLKVQKEERMIGRRALPGDLSQGERDLIQGQTGLQEG